MKKLFFALFLAFGLVACGHKELPAPPPQNGYFQGNLSYTQAENLLFKGISKSQWTVVGKEQNILHINLQYRGYNFDSDIQFSNTNYSIVFKGINAYNGNLKKAYENYKKYVMKLSKIIQKVAVEN